MTLLAKRYAKALFAACKDAGAIDAVLADLQAIGAALTDPQVAALITAPDLPSRVRRKVLDKLVAERHQLTKNFVAVLLERRREALLVDLHETFRELVLSDRGELEGVVETARTLEIEAVQQLAAIAGQLTGKTVQLTQRDAPELLGGVRLRVGNTLYDGSVATTLEDLQQQLLAAPLSAGSPPGEPAA